MEFRRHKTLRWTIPLAKVFLLSNMAIAVSHAAQLNEVASSVDMASADAANARLTQLDLNSSSISLEGLDLYLDTTLNGASAGLTHFNYRQDQLWVSTNVLQQLGFKLPPNSIEFIALNSLPDIKINYNARQQTVSIIAPLTILNLATTVLNKRLSKRTPATTSPGLLLNYNFYGTQTENNGKSLSAYSELRAFNAAGVLSSSALSTAKRSTSNRVDSSANSGDSDDSSSNAAGGWDKGTVRLDSSWSQSFPDKLLTVKAGDILTGALSWTRPTRLGGLQFGSNFNLQPYLTTTPLSSFFGEATLPSVVELYINGLRQYSGDVPAGPFQIDSTPSFNGAGNAQLVVTDILGQRSSIDFSLYDTYRLLQPGLADWSVELGVVRENYGINSFDYGDNIAASGTWRYGVNKRFTAETHAELTNGVTNAGVGGTWLLGKAGGILFASLAGSHSQGQNGAQYSASYSWNNKRLNLGLNATGTQGHYRDVATQYGSALAQRSEGFSAGYNTQTLGSFGLSYNQIAYAEQQSTRFASAYWSKSFGQRLRLNFNLNQDLNNATNNSVSMGAALSLGRNTSANSSVRYTEEQSVFVTDIAQSAPSIGGISWRAQAQHSMANSVDNEVASRSARSRSSTGLAELSYLGRYGQLQAGVSVNNSNNANTNDTNYATYASASGSLVMMGGGLFASRQINNGFAVVSTDGIANVPVLLQNNPIGSTNSRGMLLVSPLNAYQSNKISIDPMNLPADLRINKVIIEATPTDRAGSLVNFAIKPVRSASIIVTDSSKQPLPIGSQVRLLTNDNAPSAIVGFDGEVYLDTLDSYNTLEITDPSGAICKVSFDYQKQGDEIPLIGPLICQKV